MVLCGQTPPLRALPQLQFMNLTLDTGIVVDRPTATGRVFTRRSVQKAISEPAFKGSLGRGMIGGIIDRGGEHIANVTDATHVVTNARIKGNSLVVDVQLLDTPKGKELQKMIGRGVKLMAKPIISLSLDHDTSPGSTIDADIHIVRIQVELQ